MTISKVSPVFSSNILPIKSKSLSITVEANPVLAPVEENGERIEAPTDGVCANDPNLKIYDQRELIMKEFGITKEDLGLEEWERLMFKYENLEQKRKEREQRIKEEKMGIDPSSDKDKPAEEQG